MLNPIRIYILLCLCLSTLHGFSQVVVEAKLDTADILIGQQVQLQVKATTDKRTHIIFLFMRRRIRSRPAWKWSTMGRRTR